MVLPIPVAAWMKLRPAAVEGAFHGSDHLPLPRPVGGVGELEPADGVVALQAPADEPPGPLEVAADQVVEEGPDLGECEGAPDLAHPSRVEAGIGQLDADLVEAVRGRVEERVRLGLAPVQGVLLRDRLGRVAPGRLDLLDHGDHTRDHPVDPSPDRERHIGGVDLAADRDLREIALGAGVLDALVQTHGVHGPGGPGELVLQVAATQDELDQVAHPDVQFRLHSAASICDLHRKLVSEKTVKSHSGSAPAEGRP